VPAMHMEISSIIMRILNVSEETVNKHGSPQILKDRMVAYDCRIYKVRVVNSLTYILAEDDYVNANEFLYRYFSNPEPCIHD
jgi:hypothetical protein